MRVKELAIMRNEILHLTPKGCHVWGKNVNVIYNTLINSNK